MEISEDVLKIDKKFVTTKRGSRDQFLTKLKNFDPDIAGDGWIQKFFLINFDIWNVEIRVRMRKLDQFQELAPNQRTKREQYAQNWSRKQRFDGNDGGKHMNQTLTRPNQQQDLDQDTNSTRRTLKLKYAKAIARKVLGQKKE